MSTVIGCAPPNTRRAIRSTSSSVVTASRRSSSVSSVHASTADVDGPRAAGRAAVAGAVAARRRSLKYSLPVRVIQYFPTNINLKYGER